MLHIKEQEPNPCSKYIKQEQKLLAEIKELKHLLTEAAPLYWVMLGQQGKAQDWEIKVKKLLAIK